MSKAINRAYADAIRAISDMLTGKLIFHALRLVAEEPIYATNPKGDPVVVGHMEPGHYIDGHPIEYWHQIATSTLKTNDELIDRVREAEEHRSRQQNAIYDLRDSLKQKERINADLDQQLKSAEIAAAAVEKKRETVIRDLEQKLETAINDRDAWYKRSQHQHACASKAEGERDTALRELDAMREKLIHAERQMDIAHTALLKR